MDKILRTTIEPTERPALAERTPWTLYQHGEYGRSSVLAGQAFRQTVGFFTTVEDAQAWATKNLGVQAEVLEQATYQPETYIPDVAPDWYDYLDAGEYWSEKDY